MTIVLNSRIRLIVLLLGCPQSSEVAALHVSILKRSTSNRASILRRYLTPIDGSLI